MKVGKLWSEKFFCGLKIFNAALDKDIADRPMNFKITEECRRFFLFLR
jgi:hypothetical protein